MIIKCKNVEHFIKSHDCCKMALILSLRLAHYPNPLLTELEKSRQNKGTRRKQGDASAKLIT
ncbi:uncharacterized protein PHALS_14749 [Plasmopara halstedii]|uniref:Uncharacterized protein n=1 Tax=Plasmopara halstedii TaxID=4781 RepID=A0A0N7L6B5_PLAHL|nr:uncharacterized protein PHALS_14749 [Plasmopara halstedii]CEG43811.1 hypothetical protein PHALS_14749 [Plasmopara halstedii]|eukprot:XP_024580180.1 hypothetical protein PHALS_14749 [Plasmopara halstedii]